jgi:hypothetical protein
MAALAGKLDAFKRALPAKRKATAIHVGISLVILSVLLYLLLTQWYPQPYFQTDGGWQGIRIIFGVDVVLGPLLTFIIFTPTKGRRELTFDLSLVALIQAAALTWGVHTVYVQRPAAIIEYEGAFYSVLAQSYNACGQDLDALKQFDDRNPPIIFQRPPRDDETLEAMILANRWCARGAQSAYYQRFDQSLPKVFEHAAAWERQQIAANPGQKAVLDGLRAKYGADVGFLPFNGSYGRALMVLSRRGEVLEFRIAKN